MYIYTVYICIHIYLYIYIYHCIYIYIYSDYKSLFDSFSNFIFLVRFFSETENFIFFYYLVTLFIPI